MAPKFGGYALMHVDDARYNARMRLGRPSHEIPDRPGPFKYFSLTTPQNTIC